jgi:hypothetical protein
METCEFKFEWLKHIYTPFAFNTSLPVILHNVCVCYKSSYRLVTRWTTLQRSIGINFCGFFHFNPLWPPSFCCLHAVKVKEAVGIDEVVDTLCHSGYSALFLYLGGCKHGVIPLVTISCFTAPNYIPLRTLKGPLYFTPPRATPIAPTFFFSPWPLGDWDFLLGSPMLPASTSRTYMPLRPSLKSNIYPFLSKMPQLTSYLSIMPVKKIPRSKEFNCPHTNEPKFWVDHIWSLRQLGVKSAGFTSSTFPIQPDFSQNQLAAITVNTGSPRTLILGPVEVSARCPQESCCCTSSESNTVRNLGFRIRLSSCHW